MDKIKKEYPNSFVLTRYGFTFRIIVNGTHIIAKILKTPLLSRKVLINDKLVQWMDENRTPTVLDGISLCGHAKLNPKDEGKFRRGVGISIAISKALRGYNNYVRQTLATYANTINHIWLNSEAAADRKLTALERNMKEPKNDVPCTVDG